MIPVDQDTIDLHREKKSVTPDSDQHIPATSKMLRLHLDDALPERSPDTKIVVQSGAVVLHKLRKVIPRDRVAPESIRHLGRQLYSVRHPVGCLFNGEDGIQTVDPRAVRSDPEQ